MPNPNYKEKVRKKIIKIIKEKDDPICPRISAGGLESIGYYIVYRGDIKEIKRIFKLLNYYIQQYDENNSD